MYQQFWEEKLDNIRISNGHVNGNCPICNEPRRHFYANVSTGQFDCKKCQVSGNAITYLRDHERMSNKQIAECLNNHGINRQNNQTIISVEEKPHYFDKGLINRYCSNISENDLVELAEERGLSVTTLLRYKIGKNLDEFTIPVYDEVGNLRNILKRKLGGVTISSSGGRSFLFGVEDLIKPVSEGSNEIFVVEGPWSAMALKENGYRAVGTIGAGVLVSEQIELFKNKEVIFVPDVDMAGFRGATQIIKKIDVIAKSIKVVDLSGKVPEKGDIKDYFKNGGDRLEFDELVDNTKAVKNTLSAIMVADNSGQSIVKPKPFPVSILPEGWLCDYIALVSPTTEAPVQYHIATGLVALATVCKRNVFFPWTGWSDLYPNIYVLVIGESGITKKSTAINMIKPLLQKVDKGHIFEGITSLEMFCESFREFPYKVMVHDEIRNFIDNANKTYGKGMISKVTEMWSCPEEIIMNFKGIAQEHRVIRYPTPSFLAATTSEWLQLDEVDVTGGFLGRTLPICSIGGEDKSIPFPARLSLEQLDNISKHLQLISSMKPMKMQFTDEADKIYREFYHENKKLYECANNKELIRSFWSRITVNTIKIAMLYTASREFPFSNQIDKETFLKSIKTMDFIKEYYQYFLGRLSFSKEHRNLNKALEMIVDAKDGYVKVSTLMQNLHLYKKDHDELMRTLGASEQVTFGQIKTSTKPLKIAINSIRNLEVKGKLGEKLELLANY